MEVHINGLRHETDSIYIVFHVQVIWRRPFINPLLWPREVDHSGTFCPLFLWVLWIKTFLLRHILFLAYYIVGNAISDALT